MKKYEKIVDYIEKCYKNENFDENNFLFFKSRHTKSKYRLGIYSVNEKEKYFFKIIDSDKYNDEDIIKEKIKPFFTIVENLCAKKFGSIVVNLYVYVDIKNSDSYNYLRKKNVPKQEKQKKLSIFIDKYISLQKKYLYKDKMNGNCLSDSWFQERTKKNGRSEEYYGSNFKNLLYKIEKEIPELYDDYKQFFDDMYKYVDLKRDTLISYTHGDFHDFNFCLDGYFWDIDTFGYNPIMNDLIVYYWHFYKREDDLICKYSPWLLSHMYNELNNEELSDIRSIKKNEILKWFKFIKEEYRKNEISDNFNDEFIYKLFCRMFLIDNVLEYEKNDRLSVLEFFDKFLNNKKNDLTNLLF